MLKYKKMNGFKKILETDGTLKIISRYIKLFFLESSLENYILGVFTFSNIMFLLKMVGGSAWITVGFLLFVTVVIQLRLRNWAFSFFLMTIYSLQFYTPNKYYPVAVFKSYELSPNYDGYTLSYGLNIKNIFLIITLLFITNKTISKIVDLKKNITYYQILVFASGLLYFLISLYSTINYSPYIELSLVWLLHHTMMYFIAFLIYYFYSQRGELFKLINAAIYSTLFLQSVIGIGQFVKQSWVGLPIENAKFIGAYFGAPDAVQSLIRTTGTFAHSNQYALIMSVLIAIIIPVTLTQKKIFQISILISSIVGVLLTQSRAGWLALLFVLLLTYRLYKKELLNIVSIFGSLRINIIITIIVFATSFAVIPRIISSMNAFNTDSSVPTRVEMIKEASMAFILNPWLGYGVGTNEPVIFRLFPDGYIFNFPAPIHNAYVQMLLESGLIGLLSFTLPFIYILRRIFNSKFINNKIADKKTKDIIFTTLTGILSFGAYYFFQPHEGFREFYYLGIILGYGMISLSRMLKSEK